jgi:hypothetical protein
MLELQSAPMAKRPAKPSSLDAPPAVRQKQEIPGQSLEETRTLGLTDQQHEELDRQIFEKLANANIGPGVGRLSCMIILRLICEHSNGALPELQVLDACSFFDQHKDLVVQHIQKAWDSHSFRAIRDMGETSTNIQSSTLYHPNHVEILRIWQRPSQRNTEEKREAMIKCELPA